MLDKKDAQWWILEAQRHPEAATDLIRLLADRLASLDRQNEDLRGELITIRRKVRGESGGAEVEGLRERVRELEAAIHDNRGTRRMLVYAPGRIEANLAVGALPAEGLGRELAADVALLMSDATARLFAFCNDSRVYSVKLADLPAPESEAARFDQPRGVTTILNQTSFDHNRYVTLLSAGGCAYSVLAGTLNRAAARNEPLIRNLLPDDPIVAAAPSNNDDLCAISRRGRWLRFPEKTLAGTGSLVMELPKGDRLVALFAPDGDSDMMFLTSDGKVFIREASALPARKTPGRSAGMIFRDHEVLGAATLGTLHVLTRRGRLLTIQPSQIGHRARTDEGLPLPGLLADDAPITYWAG